MHFCSILHRDQLSRLEFNWWEYAVVLILQVQFLLPVMLNTKHDIIDVQVRMSD